MRILHIGVTWLLLIAVLAVNALANILPINGYNTGQISGFYPNYFVPAGFTFAIWSIIYLLLLAYAIAFSIYALKKDTSPVIQEYLKAINPYFCVTCLLNAGWILAWHYLQMLLSVAIMLSFLVILLLIFLRSHRYAPSLTRLQRLWLHTPFVVYLGWISVATIANITAMLVALKWQGAGISGIQWSILMMGIAIGLSLYIGFRFQVVSYALVVAWALWGIYKGQGGYSEGLSRVAGGGCFVLIALGVFMLLRPLISRKKTSIKN